MKKLILLLILPLYFACDTSHEKVQEEFLPISTYYIIRHAEKNLEDPDNKDPYLSDLGEDRALLWERIFKKVHFDAIYSTDYKRTLQTAVPVGIDNNTEVQIYMPDSIINESFLKENLGKNVLIVGHSNTNYKVANQLIGDDYFEEINDNDYGSVYIITLAGTGKKAEIINLN